MPAVPITSREQYIEAIGVLDRIGGTWQGVGDEDRYLLVTLAQYAALVEAEVAKPANNGKGSSVEKRPRKRTRS
jgi:hypothetical protein